MRVRVSSKGQVVIPGAIRKALGLDPGVQLDIEVVGRKIVLEPVASASPLDDLYGKFSGENFLAELEAEHQQELSGEPTLHS